MQTIRNIITYAVMVLFILAAFTGLAWLDWFGYINL